MSSKYSQEFEQPLSAQGGEAGRPTEAPQSYSPEDAHPLVWWRLLPPHLLGGAEHLQVTAALEGLAVMGGGMEGAAALAGDAAAAIGMALSLIPLRVVTLQIDIVMSALLSCALAGDPASVLVLSHVLGRCQWGDPCAEELGLAWLDRHKAFPMNREQFAASEAALAAAFCPGEE
ncbi:MULTISPECIES: hypothetical protein [Bradyrhizobium]|uniref:hypothetical protein n=1 Tax=Bradyrhizobium TaxID=374 RepID=UPI0012BD7809|nr:MULTISPECIES: hypothetical protein [Bradyrhizobium]MBR1004883.1 hypothetical protein [Bradyrhizobium liaoningense]MBR1071435.1 hypothetical protein [Bradyrhizobium liaoningense]MCP1739187.1 hypothetical protein [Bradyrhizobium japonicum]MCP1777371.1 hypothetical protein [Bradyrhizobium japonicum]MCP1856860.1 hypothetical protein [Bradyrhizobium japonicum]